MLLLLALLLLHPAPEGQAQTLQPFTPAATVAVEATLTCPVGLDMRAAQVVFRVEVAVVVEPA
jgi:hypothetical protein